MVIVVDGKVAYNFSVSLLQKCSTLCGYRPSVCGDKRVSDAYVGDQIWRDKIGGTWGEIERWIVGDKKRAGKSWRAKIVQAPVGSLVCASLRYLGRMVSACTLDFARPSDKAKSPTRLRKREAFLPLGEGRVAGFYAHAGSEIPSETGWRTRHSMACLPSSSILTLGCLVSLQEAMVLESKSRAIDISDQIFPFQLGNIGFLKYKKK